MGIVSKGSRVEIEVTQAGPAAASPRIGRRHVLGAGVGGAALSLLPFLAGRAQASAGDTTTTAPPLPPTDADVALLGQAQQIELTFVDLFETAIAAADWSDDEAAVMVEFREAHKEYAAALSALLGRHAPNTPSESLMGSLVAGFSGAKVEALALAAVRATREGTVEHGGETLPVIIGTPLKGETIDGQTFDGKSEQAVFPGDLPDDVKTLLGRDDAEAEANAIRFVRFRPPRLEVDEAGVTLSLPHIRLDRALQFLIGDRLA